MCESRLIVFSLVVDLSDSGYNWHFYFQRQKSKLFTFYFQAGAMKLEHVSSDVSEDFPPTA